MHKVLFAAVLLMLSVCAVGAQTQVPLTIDTSKFTFTAPISQKVKDAAGVWWEVTGTLTVKPTAPPIASAEAPRINAYKDAKGVPLGMVTSGQLVTITGEGFGAERGEVTWGGLQPMRVDLWSDTKIVAAMPSTMAQPVGLVTVRRPDGAWNAGAWFLGGRLMGSVLGGMGPQP